MKLKLTLTNYLNKSMTKKDIIKQEIMGTINVPSYMPYTEGKMSGDYHKYAVVDLDKLATLLAKYLDIKIEEENL